MDECNQRVENKVRGVDDFKEELWSTLVKFEEPVLIFTGLDEKGREGLLEKQGRTVDVHVEFCGSGIGSVELAR